MAGFHAALGGFHLPAVQGIFLHGSDEELAIGRKGDARMGALPFQIDGIAGGRHPVQCHTVITGNGNAQALGRKRDGLHRALFLEFLDRAVRQPDETGFADAISDSLLRPPATTPTHLRGTLAISPMLPSWPMRSTRPSSPPESRVAL